MKVPVGPISPPTISALLGEIDRTYRLEAPLPSRRRVRSYTSEGTAKNRRGRRRQS
jgi:hypothetical protein